MLGLGNSIQVSRDHTLPVILHPAGSWKYQVDKGKRPLYQGTSIPGGTDNPQTCLDLIKGSDSLEDTAGNLSHSELRGVCGKCAEGISEVQGDCFGH